MRLLRRFTQPVTRVALDVYGPEPLGEAASGVLQLLVARQLDGTGGGHVTWGAPGGFAETSQARYVDPQQFIGGAVSARGSGQLVRAPNDGIPGTTAPVGIPNSVTDLLGTLP